MAEKSNQEWYSAKELCGLPGIPGTIKGVIQKAKRENWQSRQRKAKGGGFEYHISSLPQQTRDDLLETTVNSLTVMCNPPAIQREINPADLPAPASLAKWQRDTMDARCVILNMVEQLAEIYGLNKTINKVVLQAKAGALPEHIQALIPIANARSGGESGKQVLSRRTLFRWRELKSLGVTALAPKEQAQKETIPAWAPYFLKCYRKPQKPSVADAIEELALVLPPGIGLPSLSQCYRFLNKMSTLDQERGRRTGNDLRSIMPMRRRSTEGLSPLDVVTCDGHTFKAKIAHPSHGRPFQPEVCAVLDAATRKVIGWSAGLAESAETVADALRHAIQNTGIPLIFYTDPGSGNTAHVNSHPAFGRYARIGVTFKTGQKGRTQARGLIERFQKSGWIRAAKKLETFKGSDMDGTVLHKRTRLLDKDIRIAGQSKMLPSWETFIGIICVDAMEAYNNRPHSALPKITDETGKRRKMTPNEMWAWFEAKGWQPERATETEIADMFRPRHPKPVIVNRGEVKLFGNIYFNQDLKDYHGEPVLVEYEPQDGRFVYVRDPHERLICRAEFEKNKDSYFPVSAIEKAADNRAERRRKVKERQIEEIELERRGSQLIEMQSIAITPEQEAVANEVIALADHRPKIPLFSNSWEKYEFYLSALRSGDDVPDPELAWMKRFEMMLESEEVTHGEIMNARKPGRKP